MRITVVTPRFAISGVPLAQLRFARALAARGHDVELIIGHVNEGAKLPPVESVRVQVLSKPRVVGMLRPLVRHLRERKPDVVFAAEDHLTAITLLAATLARSKAKISGSSRVTPFDTYSSRPFTKRWVLKQAMRLVMPRADALTCVSQDMVEQYRQVFRSPPHVCVYNIVVDQDALRRMEEPVDEPWLNEKRVPVIVAAGTLQPWKGFDDLLRAMKLLVERREARLIILGDGPMRGELEALVRELGLEERVKLPGFTPNPLKHFRRADVFALSSHVEGLPNVLVEAMMCGCTPVSTNCPTGPREVLQDGKYGHLVPMRDPAAMAAALDKALDHPIAPEMLREAVAPFEERVVLARHFQLLGLPEDA